MIDNLRKNFRANWLALLALALFFCPAANATQSLPLTWNPSSAAGVAGYHIYYGNKGTNFQYYADAGTNLTYQVEGLKEGETITFAVTAYNAQGVESPTSNTIEYIVPGILTVLPKAGSRSATMINFPVAPGHTYKLQASVNLTTWSTIWQTTATSNTWLQFQDVEGANLKMRFYRLVWQ